MLKDPVSDQHLDKLADFLFTNDYAVTENDVLTYWAGMPNPTNRCTTCNNRYKLLALHLGMFQTARALHMEVLQLLALNKFAEAAKGASNMVLKYIAEEIYSMKPPKDKFESRFALAGFDDFRPLMIVPAVVDYILKGRQTSGWMRTLDIGGGGWVVEAGRRVGQDPEEEFWELRERSPKFSADLAMGLQTVAMRQYGFV
jgi:hypothetical protein